MKLFRTRTGPVLESDGQHHAVTGTDWDELIALDDLPARLRRAISTSAPVDTPAADEVLAPIGSQEVWAAGVTYLRSRQARLEEAEAAGSGSFYDRVYEADRPELFFKSTAWRVVGPGQPIRIRADSRWSVPEPELTLVVSPRGRIVGYTIGNDVSARDIEGENPLYLPQAKTYDGSCAIGPCLLVHDEGLPLDTSIELSILRDGKEAFGGGTALSSMKRTPEELVDWLYRELSFPNGCLLLTGTGIVPPAGFTLAPGDEVRIHIDGIGTLSNPVAGLEVRPSPTRRNPETN